MHFNYYTATIMALSIFIPGIFAISRFNSIKRIYRPFIYLIWIGCANEVVSNYCAHRFHNSIVNNIIYTFTESIFLLWFFKRLNIFHGKKHLLNFMMVFLSGVWFTESFIAHPFGSNYTAYFNIVYPLCIVMLSIDVINRILLVETDILRNPTFLICMVLVIFFSFQMVETIFWLCGLKNSLSFRQGVQSIMIVVNFLANFVYGLSVLWMQKKRAFTLQF